MTSLASALRGKAAFVRLFGAAAIAIAVAFVYFPALKGGWIWDDAAELPQNRLVRDGPLASIWSAPDGPDYLPLKTTVQRAEWRLWGPYPFGYHAVNAALHAAGCLLFWVLLVRIGLGAGAAWLGAAIFAVHPMAVESVAWMSELKNTLSLPFLLLAMIAWTGFDRSGRRCDYWTALGLFAAAMLCKASAVMFPVVILLHAGWRRGRVGRRDLAASAPFFAVSLALGIVTLVFQLRRAIGVEALPAESLPAKVAGAGMTAAFYLWKSLAPAGLLAVYPRWKVDPPSAAQFLPLAGIAALLAWLATRRRPWARGVLFGLGFFLVNLIPVLGFFPMYYLRISRVADHLAYISLLGCAGLAAAGFAAMERRVAKGARWTEASRTPPWARAGLACAAAAVVASLAVAARARAGLFADPAVFWTAIVRRNPDSWTAHNNLGAIMAASGRLDSAAAEYGRALELDPGDAEAHFNLALALGRQGLWERAAQEHRAALRLRPSFAQAANGLGEALFRQGRAADAIPEFERAAELDPGYAEARDNLGAALAMSGRLPDAIGAFEAALRAKPDFPEAHLNLATALASAGRPAEAEEHLETALRLRPGYEAARQALQRLRMERE